MVGSVLPKNIFTVALVWELPTFGNIFDHHKYILLLVIKANNFLKKYI